MPDRPPPELPDAEQHSTHQQHFRRGLGAYPLRSREPAVLFTARTARRALRWNRGSGCAYSVSPATADPKTRKQALTLDRAGSTAAERAEIANHQQNGSWEVIDRSDVPADRNLVRLIWVYKTKRSGSLKARLCVQGCAQVAGVDYNETFCSTMRATCLRVLAAIAARDRLSMRRWDFIAAYLQGELEQGEVVNCRPPPGYETIGSDGRARRTSDDGPGSLYESFTSDLAARWNVEDEGPVSDLLNVDISRDADHVLLQQHKYIAHLVDTYVPDGVPASFHKSQAPASEDLPSLVEAALAAKAGGSNSPPELRSSY
eukprot:6213222-Pleurochrysis_carterae.AAC.4